jgi:hypothetical protein
MSELRRAPAAQPDFQNPADVGQHHGGVPLFDLVISNQRPAILPLPGLLTIEY